MTDEEMIASTIGRIPVPSKDAEFRAWERLESLTKPPGSLGRLEDAAAWVATLQDGVRPSVPRKAIVLMAADHGVTAEGVSPYPQEVTAQMVANFVHGGAAINQLARHAGATLTLIDMGVATPLPVREGFVSARIAEGTANMRRGPAMTREHAALAVRVGIETARALAEDGVDLIGTGEMGIGNTTSAAAIAAVLCGVAPSEVVGPGTGLDAPGIRHKTHVIEKSIEVNAPNAADGLDVLSKVGGFEIAGLAGVVIGAASAGIPVIVDGFISSAAALAALRMAPAAAPWMSASHRSPEPGHGILLKALGLTPVLELDMRLGEGTGAALAMEIIDAACAMMSGMATFGEAGVTDREA
jgi:nicotinate-nucleotide--dimethylbenzimidazole phosphoribosyltransferase